MSGMETGTTNAYIVQAHPPNQNNGNPGFIDDTYEHNDSDDDSSSAGSGSSSDDDSFAATLRSNHRAGGINNVDPPEEEVNCGTILRGITIEPMMFIHMFAYSTTAVVVQNLYIDRICRVSLNYTDSICANLEEHADEETEVDNIASKFVTYRSFIEAGFPIIISLFLGPWTDIHGCKWPIIAPLFGYFVSALVYLTFTYIPDAPPALLLISSAPVAAVGGLVAIIMSAFSFMSKSTNLSNRSFRVAMLEASWFLGGPLGILTGGLIYKYGGFSVVFATAAALYLISFVYGVVVIHEDLPDIPDRETRSCLADMVNVEAVKDMFATVFLRRSGLQRRWLLLMLLIISLRIFAMFGYLQNMYLFTRHQFGWSLKEYTEYSVSDSFIAITGGFVMIMTCMKIFKVPDSIIGILSTVGTIVAQFVFAFARRGWVVYVASSLQMFSGLMSIVLRSMISKIVAKEEVAKVFTFLACGEASMPLIGVPLYGYIFRHTINSFPGAMFMVSAATYTFICLSFIYLYISMRRNSNEHVQMDDPTETRA